MNHEDIRASLEAYVLGALDAKECNVVDAHLDKGCEECAAALRDVSELAAQLALAAPQYKPSDRVRQNIMAQVSGMAQAPPSVRRSKSPCAFLLLRDKA